MTVHCSSSCESWICIPCGFQTGLLIPHYKRCHLVLDAMPCVSDHTFYTLQLTGAEDAGLAWWAYASADHKSKWSTYSCWLSWSVTAWASRKANQEYGMDPCSRIQTHRWDHYTYCYNSYHHASTSILQWPFLAGVLVANAETVISRCAWR